VVERFTGFLAAERNASAETVRAYRREVERLLRFLREDGGAGGGESVDWSKVTAADLRRFFSRQFEAGRGDTGEKIRPATAARKVSAVRTFLAFLVAQGEIDANPAVGIPAPRRAMRLPEFLPVDEMDAFLRGLPCGTLREKRDAAILELLYSSGLRVGELCSLAMRDLSIESSTVRVTGKGRKVRVVPVGGKAVRAIGEYLAVRPPCAGGVPERAGRAALPQLAGDRREGDGTRDLSAERGEDPAGAPRRPGRRDRAPPVAPRDAALLRHPSSRIGGGSQGDPGDARARLAVDDPAVRAGQREPPRPDVRGGAPAGPPAVSRREGRGK